MGKIDKSVLPCTCGHRMERHYEYDYEDDEYWESFYGDDTDDDNFEIPEYVEKMVAYRCYDCNCTGFQEMTNFEFVEWTYHKRKKRK